jgi:hypothetical protein
MKKMRVALFSCAALAVVFVCIAAAQEQPADFSLFNGKIFTSDAGHP